MMATLATAPHYYNYEIVRRFTLTTLFWGILGMAMGVFIAAQLVWPELNFGIPWLSFGRIRPVHTNLVIFAFGGGALFATSFYVLQRTCRVRIISDGLANFLFWGWQAAVLAMIVSYPLGITSSKEYAEMEWPIALWVTLLWLIYAYLFFGTIARRQVRHIYVGNWFYGAFIIVTGMVHVVNHIAKPVSLLKSYSVYSGATDAMIQWWYGHSVVGFILSVGFLGMMYYFVPKQAERPIYS